MAKNGKAIGSGEERRIAKYLTKWVSGQDKDYIFWRCPSSGAIGTILEENGELCGDIIAIKQTGAFLTGKFSIEIKRNYPKSSFNSFMKKNKSDDIYSFWEQTCTGAKKAKKNPMLIYTKTRHNSLVGVPLGVVEELDCGLDEFRTLTISFEDGKLPSCMFFDLDEFFGTVTPERMEQLTFNYWENE